ncbi:HEPN domain-containing protein [Echinicola rosea]|uniref:HEPN domain-containing protein n=1 Tax=Echinicola rosea TaxID=1807691 RepID=A0ABQ1VCV5_9BACT|nr:HEPN domain-containing protein [Echinicola rosea]GGF49053.1 hypothetical protein GCM10011339_42090 [Echinicola rosea]
MTATKELFSSPTNLEASKAKLWELFKHWTTSPYRSADKQEDKDMVDFYESLCTFLEERVITDEKGAGHANTVYSQDLDEYFVHLVIAIKIILGPDRIYLFDLPALDESEEINRKEVYVLLPSVNSQTMETYKGLLGFLALGKDELCIHPINRSYLKQELMDGNLFFHYYLNEDRLIYQKDGSMELPIMEKEVKARALGEARERILAGWEIGNAFWEHVQIERKKKDWTLSVYFIHQALELWLRSLVHCWENYVKKTHEIRVLIRQCWKYIPELATVFPQDSPDEVKLLKTLEDAYCKARYQITFVVKEEIATKLFHRAECIHKLCKAHHEKSLQPIFEQF